MLYNQLNNNNLHRNSNKNFTISNSSSRPCLCNFSNNNSNNKIITSWINSQLEQTSGTEAEQRHILKVEGLFNLLKGLQEDHRAIRILVRDRDQGMAVEREHKRQEAPWMLLVQILLLEALKVLEVWESVLNPWLSYQAQSRRARRPRLRFTAAQLVSCSRIWYLNGRNRAPPKPKSAVKANDPNQTKEQASTRTSSSTCRHNSRHNRLNITF